MMQYKVCYIYLYPYKDLLRLNFLRFKAQRLRNCFSNTNIWASHKIISNTRSKLIVWWSAQWFKMWSIYDETATLERFWSWPNRVFAAIWNAIFAFKRFFPIAPETAFESLGVYLCQYLINVTWLGINARYFKNAAKGDYSEVILIHVIGREQQLRWLASMAIGIVQLKTQLVSGYESNW